MTNTEWYILWQKHDINLKNIEQNILSEKQRYASELEKLQDKCSHENVRHCYGMDSSDSYYECEACYKRWDDCI